MVALLAPAAHAHASPTPAEIEKQIDEQWSKLEPVIEEHNATKIKLTKQRKRADELSAQLAPLEQQVLVTRARIGALADQLYRGGTLAQVNAFLRSGDATAMAEMWRVLRPGGVVRLTTNVAARHREVTTEEAHYGAATASTGDGAIMFERHYDAETLDGRLLELPWEVITREYVRLRHPAVHERFAAAAPWSYVAGGALRWVAPRDFASVRSPSELAPGEMGVAYLELRKPAEAG